MAKRREAEKNEGQRQSRKEVLIARRQQRQTRQIRIAILAIAGLLLLVIIVGVINEVMIKPGMPVATVGDTEITMAEWKERVRFQRSQLIIGIEDLAEAFNQDIGQVRQFTEQQMGLLEEATSLGEIVLNELIDEELIRKEAERRGIEVSDEDVQKELEEAYGYFGGAAPTAQPTATETPVPTPSLTPIVTEVITEDVPTSTPLPTATIGPTRTPLPTSTPISRDSFQETFDETVSDFKNLGSSEAIFRDVIRAQLFEERLLEELVTEAELPDEAMHTSFFFLRFETEEEAAQALDEINASDFRTVWNTIKSTPRDVEAETPPPTASEVIWRSQDDVESLYGSELAELAFDLPLEETSGVITVVSGEGETESSQYYLILVSGREIRPLSETAINNAEQELLQTWLEEQQQLGVQIFERWRANVPNRPALDRRFWVQLTATPTTAAPAVTIPVVPEAETTPES